MIVSPWWPSWVLRPLVLLCLAILLYQLVTWVTHARRENCPPHTSAMSSSLVTANAVQRIAELATLRVPIAEVRVFELRGRLGGCRMLMAVRGSAELATDVANAIASQMGDGTYQLSLPVPEVASVRLDHAATLIYSIERTGLWRLWPGLDIESELTTRAFREAQSDLQHAFESSDWIKAAQQQVETVLRSLADSFGVRITVQWLTTASPAP